MRILNVTGKTAIETRWINPSINKATTLCELRTKNDDGKCEITFFFRGWNPLPVFNGFKSSPNVLYEWLRNNGWKEGAFVEKKLTKEKIDKKPTEGLSEDHEFSWMNDFIEWKQYIKTKTDVDAFGCVYHPSFLYSSFINKEIAYKKIDIFGTEPDIIIINQITGEVTDIQLLDQRKMDNDIDKYFSIGLNGKAIRRYKVNEEGKVEKVGD